MSKELINELSFLEVFTNILTIPTLHQDIELNTDRVPSWVKEAQIAGTTAENIAYLYLREEFGHRVKPVWTDSKKGYDLEVSGRDGRAIAYEVKAASKGLSKFHLTSNEIVVSAERSINYNLFLIDLETQKGLIINHPYEAIGLGVVANINLVVHEKPAVHICPDSYTIKINLDDICFEVVDLSNAFRRMKSKQPIR